jgi:hypothetical protein
MHWAALLPFIGALVVMTLVTFFLLKSRLI